MCNISVLQSHWSSDNLSADPGEPINLTCVISVYHADFEHGIMQ